MTAQVSMEVKVFSYFTKAKPMVEEHNLSHCVNVVYSAGELDSKRLDSGYVLTIHALG